MLILDCFSIGDENELTTGKLCFCFSQKRGRKLINLLMRGKKYYSLFHLRPQFKQMNVSFYIIKYILFPK